MKYFAYAVLFAPLLYVIYGTYISVVNTTEAEAECRIEEGYWIEGSCWAYEITITYTGTE